MSVQTEEEQIQQIKEWWQRNGVPLLVGGALALAGSFGWNAWQGQQQASAETASMLYQQLLDVSLQGEQVDVATVSKLAGQLQKDFPDSRYAVYAGLLEVRVAVEGGHLEDAVAELRRLMALKLDSGLAEIVRQRLARVLDAQGKTEEALGLLAGEALPAFVAGREELRGDLLVRLGRQGDARTAYEKARAAMPAEAGLGILQIKLDDLADKEA